MEEKKVVLEARNMKKIYNYQTPTNGSVAILNGESRWRTEPTPVEMLAET